MMDAAAAHIGFVIASYALSAVVLVGMVVAVLTRDTKLRQASEASRKGQGDAQG